MTRPPSTLPLLLAAMLLGDCLGGAIGTGRAGEPDVLPAPLDAAGRETLPTPPPAAPRRADQAPRADKAANDKPNDKRAPDGCCDDCGSRVCVAKVCVPKPGEKKVTKVCWETKCEDFCVPGRSRRCGSSCGEDGCACPSHDVWQPTCAEVRTRVVPVRKTTDRTVPTVTWSVVERCACCRGEEPDAGRCPTCLWGRWLPGWCRLPGLACVACRGAARCGE